MLISFHIGIVRLLKPYDIEMSDTQREDGKMTSEDPYVIGTDLLVYHDDDVDDDK
jgi:hypothetical protein